MIRFCIRRGYSTAKSTKPLTIGLIPGDGIGTEVIPAAQSVLSALFPPSALSFVPLKAGFELFQSTGTSLPDETVEALKSSCDGAMFGAVSSPSHKVAGYSSPIVALRKKMDLYANVRPVASPKGPFGKPIDMLIIRENTECLYIKEEKLSTESKTGLKTALATRRITEYASKRIGLMAFEMALQRHKLRMNELKANPEASIVHQTPKVTIVHKSNVLSVTDGLFRETILSLYKENPQFADVQVEEQLVDSMVYRMFKEPHMFDVVVAPNLYGDILSDGAAALVGSLGVVSSANVGGNFVMGEPVHGSAPDIAGKGISNPIAAIRSAALLLEYLGKPIEAGRIYSATNSVLSQGQVLTRDLGGKATTKEVTDAIISRL